MKFNKEVLKEKAQKLKTKLKKLGKEAAFSTQHKNGTSRYGR